MEKKVVIYSKQPCPYCVRAKAFLKEKGIPFVEIDLSNNFDEIEALKKRTNHMTMPQIFVDDMFVGGYTELVSKFQSGELKFK